MLFWVLMVVYLASLVAASVGSMLVSARLLKRPTTLVRAVCVWVISIYLGVVIATGGAANEMIVGVLSMAGLIGQYVLIKWATRARRGRAAAIMVAFLVVQSVVGIAIGFVGARRFMEPFVVPTGSMAPTIEPRDRIVADLMAPPKRWDLIVFKAPHEPGVNYVSRLVALPGETVEIVGDDIKINGVVIAKPAGLEWLKHDGTMMRAAGMLGRGCTGAPFTLGADSYFVLGDNTKQSLDSRLWPEPVERGVQGGTVPRRLIRGVVRGIYAPWTRERVF